MPPKNNLKDYLTQAYLDIVAKNIEAEKQGELSPQRPRFNPEQQYLNRVGNKYGKNIYFVGDTKVKVKKGSNNKLAISLLNLISNPDYYNSNNDDDYFNNGKTIKQKTEGQKVKIRPKSWFNRLKDRMIYGNNDESVATEQPQKQGLLQTETTQPQTQVQTQQQTDNTTTPTDETPDASSVEQDLADFQDSENVLDNKENKSIGNDFSKLVTKGVLSNIAEKGGKMNYIIYFQPGGKTEEDYSTWEKLKRARNNVKYGHPELTEHDKEMVKLGNKKIAPWGAAAIGAGLTLPYLVESGMPILDEVSETPFKDYMYEPLKATERIMHNDLAKQAALDAMERAAQVPIDIFTAASWPINGYTIGMGLSELFKKRDKNK